MNDDKKSKILFILTFIFTTIYLLWRTFFTLPIQEGFWNMFFGILLLLAEITTTFTTFELYYNKMKNKQKVLELPSIPDEAYPDVDVFIATHNEPIELLYTTVNACTYMEYPDKNKVHIYLCDDGNRAEVKELAERLSVGYLGLADNQHAKSGNLNNALKHTKSPLIATFDADMIPQRTFLMETVPYFLLPEYKKEANGIYRIRKKEEIDPNFKIGLIQTPQSFYNQDLFQFNLYAQNSIPNEQDFFSKEINTLRNVTNSVAYTGSNTVIARCAMEEIGGFPYDTITEDFETSIRIQKAGYITYSTSKVLAAGLSTTTIPSMISQRIRWAQGVIQSIQNTNAIFTKKLPIRANISYLNAFLYWWSFFNRFIFILSPILFALFDFKLVECGFLELSIFWIPSFILYNLSMRYLSSHIRSQRWSQIIDTILAPYLVLPVFLETIGIHQRKFKVTNKRKTSSHTTKLYFIIPHLFLSMLSIIALIKFIYGKYGWSLFYSSVIIFWLGYNLIALCYAIFFMLGRPSYRKYERIRAKEKLTITYHGFTMQGYTDDVSQQGISFILDKPIHISKNDTFEIHITTKHYYAVLKAHLIYVTEKNNAWLYGASIEAKTETDLREYLQIIHDRLHSLPTKIDPWMTSYDDFIRNIRLRLHPGIRQRREAARVKINKVIRFEEGIQAVIYDFNFYYFTLMQISDSQQDELTLRLPALSLQLKKVKDIIAHHGTLYELTNAQEVLNHGIQLYQIVEFINEMEVIS